MKTYPLLDDVGDLTGFEVPNIYFPTSASVSRFFAKCPGVRVLRQRKMFDSGEDVHAEIAFDGNTFIVWEPFGDNSRFWIGPKDKSNFELDQLQRLHEFVSSNWPGPISRTLSYLIPWHR